MILWIVLFLPWQIAYPEDRLPGVDIIILVQLNQSYVDILYHRHNSSYENHILQWRKWGNLRLEADNEKLCL